VPRHRFLVGIFFFVASFAVGQPVAVNCALELVIHANAVVRHNPVTDENFKIHPFTVSSTDGDPLHIVVENEDGTEVTLPLPDAIARRLIDYFVNGIPDPFDCNCFIHYVNGLPWKCGEVDYSNWSFEAIDPSGLIPGDSFIMGNREGETFFQPTHAALYLGAGFFISKFNQYGPVIVARLDEMTQGFNATEGFLFVPRLSLRGAP